MFLLLFCCIAGALATACLPSGNLVATCVNEKCEVVGQTEICTQCKAGGVPVDGLCRPSSSPHVSAAGCAVGESGVCSSCSGSGYILFRGGCYRKGEGMSELGGPGMKAAATCTVSNNGPGSCETCGVRIGDGEYCAKCKTGADRLIDGVCVGDNDDTKCKTNNAGACESCGDGYFLHKGGCYKITGKPGNLICESASAASGGRAVAGVCGVCKAGYFSNPTAANDATHQSCVACDDTAGADGYRGVDKCKKCRPPSKAGSATCDTCEEGYFGASCTACGDENCAECTEATTKKKCSKCKATSKTYLKKDTGSETGTCVTADECTADKDYYTDDTDPKTCKACADGTFVNCKTCTKAATTVSCTACKENMVFGLGKKSCVAKCPDNSEVKAENTCACKDGFKPNEEGTQCIAGDAPKPCATSECKTCDKPRTDAEICTECNVGRSLTPTGQCIDDCATIPGYYGATEGSKKVCKKCGVENCVVCGKDGTCDLCTDGFYGGSCSKCDSSCKNCNGSTAEDCTECPSGKALKYDTTGKKGTCGDGCTPNTSNCEKCDLAVDGTAYCSKCKEANQFPQNGVCVAAGGRAITCTSQGTGVCNTCAAGSFRMDGGCYEDTKYPGKSVCSEANPAGDSCKTAAHGYKLEGGTLTTCPSNCEVCSSSTVCTTCMGGYFKTSSNTCTKCDAGCATCTGTASTCSSCADGYYLSNSKCIACDRSDGSITGVSDCLSCAAPSSNTGPVLCYLVGDGCWPHLLMCL